MRSIIVSMALLIAASSETSANPRADHVFGRIVTEFILPGFRGLAEKARMHEAIWKDYCSTPTAAGLSDLSKSFHSLADQWASIEMVRTGPAFEEFRHERFYFWPERKNAVERGLAKILELPETATFTSERIRTESAAVQGLPALERLIFTDGLPNPSLGQAGEGKTSCRVGQAIAGNAAGLAEEIRNGWEARTETASNEAKVALATDLVTAYSIIKDTKIETVIGDSADQVRPRAAEFWRSGRTMQNIVVNLEALDRINQILVEALPEDAALPAATHSAASIAKSLPPDLASLAAGEKRSDALLLRDAIDAAGDIALAELPSALGVTVGFTSLDGD